jgi:geranylgeranyl diphosphate synthase type II
MDGVTRIERTLDAAISRAEAAGAPPRLAAAMRHAVFPRGARVRPRLALAVAAACGEDDPPLSDAAAAAVELLHCASLVHDDLPCFDDAETRRGRPSVHRAFGQPLAVLAGDALIVLAFQTLARAGAASPSRLPALITAVGEGVGVPHGIVAGQAWECEPRADLDEYHRQKTGALFAAAAAAGAAAAGMAEPGPWRAVGMRLGEAYQVADDLRDACADAEEMGKPAGRDAALGRPSIVLSHGISAALARLEELAAAAASAIPPCPGAAELRALIRGEARRLMPRSLAASAA